ncbi:peptidoglycan-binding protein [Scytonema sp. UIC 10036]|uniref:peptidoglycan-binding domain-containing protein n=1 Tax=Scytonema sp. UIC 10036 TaxID=2304196 RepID=UPI0012DADCF0|nr:peptidoglycan-binding protein [Scytonema sp. UIC 10036]MUG97065.1 peptidoglycan-binding protein [Scytonema sp. UIC 10036]
MWCVLRKSSVSIATACLITTSIVITDTAFAALRYTPQQFRSVLRGLGYNIKVSNAPLTEADAKKVIIEFQKGYKLKPADGVAGEKTQDFAATTVEILQGNLNLVVKPDPLLPKNQYYGPRTEAAVKLYQKKVGLQETGIADLALRQRLDQEAKEILNKTEPTPTAEPSPTTSPTSKPQPTRKPSSTPTTSPKPKPTSTPEASPTETPTPEATETPTPTATSTPTP